MIQRPSAKTFLWFQDNLDEALAFYQNTFHNVEVHSVRRQAEDGPIFIAEFSIFGHEMVAMSAPGGPTFNDSISIAISCDGQAEVDRLWDAFTAEGSAGKCGWLKDKWGVSWQITPIQMGAYLSDPDPAKAQYAWQAMRGMTKIVLADFVDPANAALGLPE